MLAAAWPAWRAAGRPPVACCRARGWPAVADRAAVALAARRAPGSTALGVRLVAARRGRLAATVLTLGTSAAFVLLLLALASALSVLETDPGALGKRYQLTSSVPAAEAQRSVRAVPGVQAAAARYELQAVDSFSLGETIDVIAYPDDHTIFEAPPLTAGHRLKGIGEAEVGAGLADALGLSPGSTLAIALPSGVELRLRVAGIVSSLDHDGRVAYIPAAALLKADRSAPEADRGSPVPSAPIRRRSSTALTALGCPAATAARARPRAGCRSSIRCGRSCGRSRSSMGSSACTR